MRIHLFVIVFLCLASYINAQHFEKLDYGIISDETELYNAAAGGFTSPLIYSFDLNADGVKELISFDKAGACFNVFGYDPAIQDYKAMIHPSVIFPRLGNWAIITDYNFDGIIDIFTYPQTGPGGFEVWRGYKENSITKFQNVDLKQGFFNILYFQSPSSGKLNIYVSAVDLACLRDIDADGDMDLLTFNPDGVYLELYKNTAKEKGYTADSLLYTRQDLCYGKFQENGFTNEINLSADPNSCASAFQDPPLETRHSGSTTCLVDADHDGILDILLGDVSFENVNFLRNTGTNAKGFITENHMHFPPQTNGVRLGPFPAPTSLQLFPDNREFLIFTPNSGGLVDETKMNWLYRFDPATTGQYAIVDSNYLRKQMFDLGTGCHPTAFDYNQDGLPDLILGSDLNRVGSNYFGSLALLINTSSGDNISFSLENDDFLNLKAQGTNNYTYQPCFGDLDNDGYPDLLVGTQSGYLMHFESRTKAPEAYDFQLVSDKYQSIRVGSRAAPAIVDQDQDGDMDLIVGDNNGQFALFINSGTTQNPTFNPDPLSLPNVYPYGKISVRENNEIVGMSNAQLINIEGTTQILSGNSKGNLFLLGPVTTDKNTQFSSNQLQLTVDFDGRGSHPLLVDLNGDKKNELVLGNIRGGYTIYSTDIYTDGSVNNNIILNNNQIELSPNPAAPGDRVKVTDEPFGKKISLFDFQGNIIASYKNIGEFLLPDFIASGVYFVALKQNNGTEIIKKLIVNH